MNFELGKKYIVEVTEKGIIPRDEFLEERYIDKDFDDLDFLTDEEKVVVINDVLDKISAEIETKCCITVGRENDPAVTLYDIFQIIDKYKTPLDANKAKEFCGKDD